VTYRLEFEPSFVEEAVFWTVRSLEAAGDRSIASAYHTERNSIYEGARSEEAFQELAASFFVTLGLRALFEELLAEFTRLDLNTMVLIRRAFGKKEEGSELYWEGDLKTVFLSLQTKRVLERPFLHAFVRHELLRISDMLDPGFEYSPKTPLGGDSPAEENLIRDRFRFLWDLYIDRRLVQNLPASKAFQEIGKRRHWTQGQLLELAKNGRASEMSAQGGFECPLCRFHSYEQISDGQGREAAVFRKIERDHPGWERSRGICRQCFELYRSRVNVSV